MTINQETKNLLIEVCQRELQGIQDGVDLKGFASDTDTQERQIITDFIGQLNAQE